MYYLDPDGNRLETQVDNFDTSEEAKQFMESQEFAENFVGVDFKVDDLIKRFNSGEDEKNIKKRENIGPRGLDNVPQLQSLTA
jgi:hypothetical protein